MKLEQNIVGVTDVDFTQNDNAFTGTETLQKHTYFVNDLSVAMAKKNFIMRFLKRIPLEDLERLVNLQQEDVTLEGQYTEGCKLSAELNIIDSVEDKSYLQIILDNGFESISEYHRLLARADISSPFKLSAFKTWQNEDGTKNGLLNLIQIN